jgi:hypothetical protein
MDKIRLAKQIISTVGEIQQCVFSQLTEEEDFTGKITIDINFNQGGITNTDVYTKRRIDIKPKNNIHK